MSGLYDPTGSRAALVRRWYAEGLYGHDTLADVISRGAALNGGARVIFHTEAGRTETTLAELHALSLRVASALHELGLRAGDVIAIQVPNRLEGTAVYEAAMQLGAVILPIVHIYGAREVDYILREARAKAYIVADRWRNIDYLAQLTQLGDLPDLEHVVVVGEAAPSGAVSWDQLMALATPDFPRPGSHPDDPALIVFTSGTTAAPKGVVHSHNSLLATNRMRVVNEAVERDSVCLVPTPAGHIGSVIGILRLYLSGPNTILMDSWNAAIGARLVEEFGVTHISGAVIFLSSIIEAARESGADLSSLRSFLAGAASVPAAIIERADAAGVPATRCYGSSEHPTATSCQADDPLERRAYTDGRPTLGTEARIVDGEGRPCAPGEEGELCLIGAPQFLGYLQPELNEDAFTPDGWLLTGDIGRLDEAGYLTITDRKKDIIIRGGENIASKEVEDILARHPAVAESAVVPMPDAVMGERVCAFVILRKGERLESEDVARHFAASGAARQKTPERLVFVEDFPRTISGKVKKFELRDEARRLAQAAAGSSQR